MKKFSNLSWREKTSQKFLEIKKIHGLKNIVKFPGKIENQVRRCHTLSYYVILFSSPIGLTPHV